MAHSLQVALQINKQDINGRQAYIRERNSVKN